MPSSAALISKSSFAARPIVLFVLEVPPCGGVVLQRFDRPMEPRFDSPDGDAEGGGDVFLCHAVEGFHEKNFALLFGELPNDRPEVVMQRAGLIGRGRKVGGGFDRNRLVSISLTNQIDGAAADDRVQQRGHLRREREP